MQEQKFQAFSVLKQQFGGLCMKLTGYEGQPLKTEISLSVVWQQFIHIFSFGSFSLHQPFQAEG